ncbi:transcriptional regulator [Tersicoccus solisilvae]|uniref:Transcriptional regulator n=1 Tax=Tersicoccus solisilvae TaxID=1882339 RepID=A0ABQ1NIW5_9MICC|nr:IclR family transcriptional regulator [Tersicoccus solisilvae]GGC78192.1 transcriptional regulator [Tersicoccus solisilvae]
MSGGSREPGRTVTSRVLAVLEAFETERRSLTLTEIADHAQLPLSTAHRLVGELTDWGMLSRNAAGRYQVGIRLWELAQNAGRALRETARPFLQDLYSLTGETAHLAVRQGGEALYIDRVYGTKRVPRAARVGGRLPLHATAVGKVLLAFEEDWVREAYLAGDLEQRTAHTHVHPGRLADELVRIRAQGYATTAGEVREGSCSIAVPVFHTGRLGAAIGVVMPSNQADTMHRYLPTLRGVSGRLERATAHIPLETLLTAVTPGADRPRRSR